MTKGETMKLKQLYRDLGPGLSLVEEELENAVSANHSDLREASLHLLKAGGKRIRPVFVLLCAQFGRNNMDQIKRVAAALELIHMASLVHDDVIDDSDLRRGRPTIKAKWDNRVAMYTGDYMLAKALELITAIDNPRLHETLSDAIVEMSIGEIEQIRDLYDWNQHFRHYLRRVKRKTALLIAVSCRLGSMVAGVDEATSKQLYRFGYYVGMSFQITDDILDFTGYEERIGKPAGSDLRQGNLTLPVLYALKDGNNRSDIVAFLKFPHSDQNDWEHILKLVTDSGGVEFARKWSAAYLQKAYETLEKLPHVKARDTLLQMAVSLGNRSF